MSADTGPVVLITADLDLEADLARLAAAAGARLETYADLDRLPAAWSASLVLVGRDLLGPVALSAPVRRDRVYVIGRERSEPDLEEVLACGAEAVYRLPDQEETVVGLLTDVDRVTRAVTVGVIGGAGGAGATTFATAVAVTASRAGSTLVVDGDQLGAGIDQVLGMDPEAGIRWDALLASSGRLAGRALRAALPQWEALSVLAWPVERLEVADGSGVREVVSAAARGFGAVVVDLPRGSQPVADELVPRCDLVVVVVPATVPALVSAARVVRRLPVPAPVLVIRRRPGGVDPASAGKFLGIDSVVAMADQRGLDEDVALGLGPLRRSRGPLARAAADVVALTLGSAAAASLDAAR